MNLYQWLCVLGIPSLVISSFGIIVSQFRQLKALKLGLQAILRDRLLQAFHHCDEKGFADSDDRQNFENMYIQYHSLGGNGVMENLRQKFLDLPMK